MKQGSHSAGHEDEERLQFARGQIGSPGGGAGGSVVSELAITN